MPAALWSRRAQSPPRPPHGGAGAGGASNNKNGTTTATATNLRWRARIAKEAMAFPFDDSSTVAFDDDTLDSKSLKSTASHPSSLFRRLCGACSSSFRGRQLLRRGVKPVIVPACVAGAVASSLYALTVSTHVVVALASALTVAIAVIVLIQQHLLHAGGSVQRSHVAQQTQALHNLQVQKERLYRQVLQLDETAERRRDVHRQLQSHAADMATTKATQDVKSEPAENVAAPSSQRNSANGDIGAAMRIAALYKETATTLLQQSQNELVVQIAKSMVHCVDAAEGNNTSAEEALLTNLRGVQGVAFDEKLVRQYLAEARGSSASASDESSTAASVLGHVNLLRQAMMDGELAAMSGIASAGMDGNGPGTPQRRKRRLRAQQQQQLQQRKQLSAVFVFDPDKRINGTSTV
jgi:hypothetical protein